MYVKTHTYIFNGKRLDGSSLRSGIRKKACNCHFYSTFSWKFCLGYLARKRNNSSMNKSGRSENVFSFSEDSIEKNSSVEFFCRTKLICKIAIRPQYVQHSSTMQGQYSRQVVVLFTKIEQRKNEIKRLRTIPVTKNIKP